MENILKAQPNAMSEMLLGEIRSRQQNADTRTTSARPIKNAVEQIIAANDEGDLDVGEKKTSSG